MRIFYSLVIIFYINSLPPFILNYSYYKTKANQSMQSSDLDIKQLSISTPGQIQRESIQQQVDQIRIQSDQQKKTTDQEIDDSIKSILGKEYENRALLIEKEKLEKIIDQLKKDTEYLQMEVKNGINQKDRIYQFFDQEKQIIREFNQKSLKKLQEIKELQLQRLKKTHQKQLQRSQNAAKKFTQVTKQNIRLEIEEKYLKKNIKTTNCVYLSIFAVLALLLIGTCILSSTLFTSNEERSIEMRQREMGLKYAQMYYNRMQNSKL